jgi:hypothetical protein
MHGEYKVKFTKYCHKTETRKQQSVLNTISFMMLRCTMYYVTMYVCSLREIIWHVMIKIPTCLDICIMLCIMLCAHYREKHEWWCVNIINTYRMSWYSYLFYIKILSSRFYSSLDIHLATFSTLKLQYWLSLLLSYQKLHLLVSYLPRIIWDTQIRCVGKTQSL